MNDCVIEIYNYQCSLFTAYFLEDIVQLLDFDPTPDKRKRKNKKKEDDEDAEAIVEGDENMNKIVSNEYSELTRSRVAALSEKDISFELIEVRNHVLL